MPYVALNLQHSNRDHVVRRVVSQDKGLKALNKACRTFPDISPRRVIQNLQQMSGGGLSGGGLSGGALPWRGVSNIPRSVSGTMQAPLIAPASMHAAPLQMHLPQPLPVASTTALHASTPPFM